MSSLLPCFKAYDIRGVVPDELNEDLAYRIGAAYAQVFPGESVAVGRDVRPSGESLVAALTDGLTDAGVRVVDIGVCGTEQVYFATAHLGLSGGIMVTASHNPPEYNGMKMVREQAIPISLDSGLKEIEALVRENPPRRSARKGVREEVDITNDYVKHLLQYVDVDALKPLTIAANPGNGCAGPILERLMRHLPFNVVTIHEQPDGSFPNGVPNPLLIENRQVTTDLVLAHRADLGVAWDGDFDRCFFFDELGRFVEGYYVVGLLAQAILQSNPGATIIHDPRLTWCTIEIVEQHGGKAVQCKSGHAFIKERMRAEDAAYGGEMSAHHYFRDFFYCDSGMIPWLLVTGLLSSQKRPLSAMVDELAARYPVSGEINRKLDDPHKTLKRIEEIYVTPQAKVDRTDGLSVEYADWRFNVRLSNTEPLLRLNVEARGDADLMREKTDELLRLIDS